MRALGPWVLVCWMVASVAAAQTCAPGRIASEESAGRCCWPGQTWSAEHARCEGVPTCPAGYGGEGETCVALAAPPVATPPVAPTVLYALPQPPPARSVNWNVVGGGIALFLTTYGPALAFGALAGRCQAGSIASMVPFGALVGGPLYLGCAPYGEPTIGAIEIAYGLGEILGVVLIGLGMSTFRRSAALEALRIDQRGIGIVF
jgi:hypothetical protein